MRFRRQAELEALLPTIGEMKDDFRLILCTCRTCGRRAQIGAETLLDRFSPYTRVWMAARAMICSRCGSKDIKTEPGDKPRSSYYYPAKGKVLLPDRNA